MGGFIAIQRFRHKNKKQAFLTPYYAATGLNVAGACMHVCMCMARVCMCVNVIIYNQIINNKNSLKPLLKESIMKGFMKEFLINDINECIKYVDNDDKLMGLVFTSCCKIRKGRRK